MQKGLGGGESGARAGDRGILWASNVSCPFLSLLKAQVVAALTPDRVPSAPLYIYAETRGGIGCGESEDI